MRLGSVRVRLTALVVLVAALVMVLAATIGVSRVEQSLVDDTLADTADQMAVTGFLTDDPFVEEGFEEGLGELSSEFDFGFPGEENFVIEEIDALVVELERIGAVDTLLAAAGRERGEGLAVLSGFGVMVVAGLDGDATRTYDGAAVDFGGPVAFDFNLQELAFSGLELDTEDLFRQAEEEGIFDDERFEQLWQQALDERAARMDVEATVREIGGVPFVVAADVADVRRSADTLRSIAWTALPVLMAGAGLVTWVLTGRALRPVHRITERVGVIDAGTLHERVPVPGTADEVEELARTMNRMLDRLEADDQRLRQFVSDASHELRSPVAVLRSEAEVALRSPQAISAEALAAGVLGESRRLERIVEDLLVLARGDEAGAAAAAADVDLDDVVLEEADRRRRVAIDTRSVSAGRVRGTRPDCSRVLVHLLDNAARHAVSRAAVGLRTEQGTVVLWVDDDGPGVAVADRDRIFERFTRLEAARTRDTGGAGLGLAVVRDTVRAMGGTVTVEDSPLGGARFVVRVPAAPSVADLAPA